MSNEKVTFANPEQITEQEIVDLFRKYPIDFVRVRQFLDKEPGIKEAFLSYTESYVTEFRNMVGVEFTPNVYARLREIMIICLTVGYLTKENFFNKSLEKAVKEETDGTAPAH